MINADWALKQIRFGGKEYFEKEKKCFLMPGSVHR